MLLYAVWEVMTPLIDLLVRTGIPGGYLALSTEKISPQRSLRIDIS
jgi:hypothetical protein